MRGQDRHKGWREIGQRQGMRDVGESGRGVEDQDSRRETEKRIFSPNRSHRTVFPESFALGPFAPIVRPGTVFPESFAPGSFSPNRFPP